MCLYFIPNHKCDHKTFRIDEMNKSFQLFDESEDSWGCASWGSVHTPLLPLDLGGLRPPGYGWSIEGCTTRWRLKYVWGRARKISKTPSSGDKDKNPWFLRLRHSIKEFHVWNLCLFCQTRDLTTGLTSCLPRYFNYQPLGAPMLGNYGIVCQKTMG